VNAHGVVAAAILHNTAAGTYHPIIYRDSPLPGPYDETKPRRLKSIGHHTFGFGTLDEAKSHLTDDPRYEGAVMELENLFEWDGSGIPADVAFLSADGKFVHF
jgi:hypothetical protein